MLADAAWQVVRMPAEPQAGEEDDERAQEAERGDAVGRWSDADRLVTAGWPLAVGSWLY
jgi:hypothetical protein